MGQVGGLPRKNVQTQVSRSHLWLGEMRIFNHNGRCGDDRRGEDRQSEDRRSEDRRREHGRDDWCRIHNEWTLIKEGRTQTFGFEHAIYSGRELKERLLAAGFRQVRLFGNLEGAPYGLDAARLIAVATK